MDTTGLVPLFPPPPPGVPLPPHTPAAPHEFKLSIGWDEADASLRVKLAESHTLVEGAVINGN